MDTALLNWEAINVDLSTIIVPVETLDKAGPVLAVNVHGAVTFKEPKPLFTNTALLELP